MNSRFPAANRLKKSSEFGSVQRDGRKLYSKGFILFVQPVTSAPSKIGLTVSRKVSLDATVRNKIKRRLREIFRRLASEISPPIYLVVIAKPAAVELSYLEIESQIVNLLQKAKVFPHRLLLAKET